MRLISTMIWCALLFVSTLVPFAHAKSLTVGILSFRPKAETIARWQPLADYLSRSLPGKSVIIRAYNFSDLNQAVAQHEIDFVFTNPAHYIELRERNAMSGALATLIEDDGGKQLTVFGGVIFTDGSRPDIVDLQDARGKRFAFADRYSLGSYQMQALQLLRSGVPLPDHAHSINTGLPQDKVVAAVLSGAADVGLVRTGLLENMAREGKIDLKRIRILNPRSVDGFPFLLSTELYPEWPFIAMPWVDRDDARRIASALLALDDDNPVAIKTKIHGFNIPGDYSSVENLMRALRTPPFDAPLPVTFFDLWYQNSVLIVIIGIAIAIILILLCWLLFKNRQIRQARARADLIAGKLSASENMLKRAQAVAGLGSWYHNVISGHLEWSDEICRIFDLAPGAPLTLETFGAALHPDDRERVRTAWQDALNGQSHDVEHRIVVNGRIKWIRERAEIRFGRDGQPLESIGTVQDITERKRAESAVLEARRQAEAANRAKSAFLANMSHEIRTPVTGVLGMVDLLKKTSINDEQQTYLNILASSTASLLAILNDILDISKIEANKLVIEAVEFDLRHAAGDVFDLCCGLASAKGLELTLKGVELVPRRVIGDPVRLKQILHNLISNAIKFTEAGVVSVGFAVSERRGELTTLVIEVRDTGIGMNSDQINRLFQPFSQADASTTRRFGGTGLGLAIVKRLVELMGGEIGVESATGKGSCFRVLLPFTTVAADGPEPLPAPLQDRPMLPPVAPCRPLRILLAEDHLINQRLVRTMLQKLGHTVVVAGNGAEAVRAVASQEFDAVLMDMQMPEMDGEEATRVIRAMSLPKCLVPIIALTADVMVEHRERYLAAGIDCLIAKPIDWDALTRALAEAAKGCAGSR